jgi:hypothetical protein
MIPFFTAGFKNSQLLFDPYTDEDVELFVDFEDSWTQENIGKILYPERMHIQPSSTSPYEGFSTTAGTGLFTAINNAGGAGTASIAIGTTWASGQTVRVKLTCTNNGTGLLPTLRWTNNANSPGAQLNGTFAPEVVEGYNDFTLTATNNINGTASTFLHFFVDDEADYTIQIHEIIRDTWIITIPDSRNNGIEFQSRHAFGIVTIGTYYSLENNTGVHRVSSAANLTSPEIPLGFRTTWTVMSLRDFTGNKGWSFRNGANVDSVTQPLFEAVSTVNPDSPVNTWIYPENPQQINQMFAAQMDAPAIGFIYRIGSAHSTRISHRANIKLYLLTKPNITLEKEQLIKEYLKNRI